MGWWDRKPEERARWVLDPLVAVGPLRFGMDHDEVKAALDGEWTGGGQRAADGWRWTPYDGDCVIAVYDQDCHLVAVKINAKGGPFVRLDDVELIGRVPSEARAEILGLAARRGAAMGTNRIGDPQITAWGISMSTEQEWGRLPEGHVMRKDAVITSALFTAPRVADDTAASVIEGHDVRDLVANQGAWPVTPDSERPRWDWTPLEHVGPLRFGMSPPQVTAALGGETPDGRTGAFPFWFWKESGQWSLHTDHFERAGVTAQYWYPDGVPELGAVTVHGRTRPQLHYEGTPLVGITPSILEAAIIQHVEDHDLGLRFGPSGAAVPDGPNLYLDTARAEDSSVSEPTFCAKEWQI
ncbi:hypothetical protein ACFWHQ_10620 [Streptomyces sp. NPDC060334]|uniref:hypothetical protein n=1 Tax=Streptomyces sp. NPDC060334 TaxID=3347099 RepID=UPI003662C108